MALSTLAHLLACAVTACCAFAAQAQALGPAPASAPASAPAPGQAGAKARDGGTLAKILHTGSITLGVREGAMPFSYLDDRQQYQGYSIELCLKVVQAVQKHLGLSRLRVGMIPVTAADRMALMTSGGIDLECGSTTNTAERQKQVAFSSTIFVVSSRLLAKKSARIASLADLRGRTLAITADTTTLKQMAQLNSERRLEMRIVVGKDHPESFLMLETGRAAAVASDDILLAGLMATADNPQAFEITREPLSVEYYGLMMRRGDPAFKQVVDAALARLYQSEEFGRLYGKWFLSPIPPKGINLNFPISPQLAAAIARAAEAPEPAAYR